MKGSTGEPPEVGYNVPQKQTHLDEDWEVEFPR